MGVVLPVVSLFVWFTLCTGSATAQPAQASGQDAEQRKGSRGATALAFLGGAATALGAHEASHLAFDLIFDARPGIKRVDYAGIPFFAVTHRPVSRRREFTISSAGFWTQHAVDEWLLTTRPNLRGARAPFEKGLLAFNVLASGAYAAAALTRTGPPERDTRGIALSIGTGGIDERWVGVLLLTPASLDVYRYFKPHARWAVWTSRALKVGLVVLVLR